MQRARGRQGSPNAGGSVCVGYEGRGDNNACRHRLGRARHADKPAQELARNREALNSGRTKTHLTCLGTDGARRSIAQYHAARLLGCTAAHELAHEKKTDKKGEKSRTYRPPMGRPGAGHKNAQEKSLLGHRLCPAASRRRP